MSLWKRFFSKSRDVDLPAADVPEQHCVSITIRIPSGHPSQTDWDWVFTLQDEIGQALTASGTGELDGDLWGQGECIIYCYGNDAEAMWEAIMPVLEPHSIPNGSFAIKHFGGAGSGREERVNIGWEG